MFWLIPIVSLDYLCLLLSCQFTAIEYRALINKMEKLWAKTDNAKFMTKVNTINSFEIWQLIWTKRRLSQLYNNIRTYYKSIRFALVIIQMIVCDECICLAHIDSLNNGWIIFLFLFIYLFAFFCFLLIGQFYCFCYVQCSISILLRFMNVQYSR